MLLIKTLKDTPIQSPKLASLLNFHFLDLHLAK